MLSNTNSTVFALGNQNSEMLHLLYLQLLDVTYKYVCYDNIYLYALYTVQGYKDELPNITISVTMRNFGCSSVNKNAMATTCINIY